MTGNCIMSRGEKELSCSASDVNFIHLGVFSYNLQKVGGVF